MSDAYERRILRILDAFGSGRMKRSDYAELLRSIPSVQLRMGDADNPSPDDYGASFYMVKTSDGPTIVDTNRGRLRPMRDVEGWYLPEEQAANVKDINSLNIDWKKFNKYFE